MSVSYSKRPKVIRRNKRTYEEYLNEWYAELNEEDFLEHFSYLTVKRSMDEKPLTVKRLKNYYANSLGGYVLRKFDSIAFQKGFQDYINQ